MVRLNPDKEIVKTVKEGLAARGGYCPCVREKSEDTNVCARNSASRLKTRILKAFAIVCCIIRIKHKRLLKKKNRIMLYTETAAQFFVPPCVCLCATQK